MFFATNAEFTGENIIAKNSWNRRRELPSVFPSPPLSIRLHSVALSMYINPIVLSDMSIEQEDARGAQKCRPGRDGGGYFWENTPFYRKMRECLK